jgi:hypothetical protein
MYTLKKAPEIYILYFTLLDSKTRSKLGKKDYYQLKNIPPTVNAAWNP